MSDVPEDCRLTYHDTGDGFALCVENRRGEVVAYLAWPKAWPKIVSSEFVEECGFENV